MANTIHPEAEAFLNLLSANPLPDQLRQAGAVARFRAMAAASLSFQGEPEPVYRFDDDMIVTSAGSLPVRLYRPAAGVLPVLLFFHGGGFVSGSTATYDPALRMLANVTGWCVAAVDYRLAPEHPFPAAPEDCYASLAWLADNAAKYDVRPSSIVTIGDSAGGQLAAVVAMMARDRGGPIPAGIVALYPNADLRIDREYPSLRQHDGTLILRSDVDEVLQAYLPTGIDRKLPYVSPGLAEDLSGLPPTMIATCECDPLRDEGELFARELAGAGVNVRSICLKGMIHGVLSLGGVLSSTRRLAADIREFLTTL